jgi:hypothetical protein
VQPFTASKREAHDLEQYEADHSLPHGALARCGWRYVERRGRPALTFSTKHGPRYRFLDGQKPKYDQDIGYQPCWFGLERAFAKGGEIVVDCNGAASTIAADLRGIPAYSLQAGEETNPTPENIAEFQGLADGRRWTYDGLIYVVFDCDPVGRRAAVKRTKLYRKLGYIAFALDLGMDKPGADLADFVALHPDDAMEALQALPTIPIPEDEPEPPANPGSGATYAPPTEQDRVETAQAALNVLSTFRREDYDTWYQVGMCLQELGSVGLNMWDTWSQGSEKYKPGSCARKWKTFRKNDKTLASLFYMADEDYGKSWRPYKATVRADDNFTVKISPENVQANDKPREQPHSSNPFWPKGLPFNLRSALNLYAPSCVAPTLELINEAIDQGLLDPTVPIDVKYLLCLSELLGRGLNESAIRSATKQVAVQFLGKLSDSYVLPVSKNESESGGSVRGGTEICKNPLLAGRKANLFQLLPKSTILANIARAAIVPILQKAFPLDEGPLAPIRAEFLEHLGKPADEAQRMQQELEAKYGALLASQPGYKPALERARVEFKRFVRSLQSTETHAIPRGWTYNRASEYVICCARAYLEGKGGSDQVGRKVLAARVGCSAESRQVDSIMQRAGAKSEPQFADRPITSLPQLQAIEGKYDDEWKGRPIEVVSSLRHNTFPFEDKQCYIWALNEMRQGADVFLRYQQAHRWTIVSETRPVIQPKPKAEPVAPQPTLFTLPPIVVKSWHWFMLKAKFALKAAIAMFKMQASAPKPAWEARWVEGVLQIVTPWKIVEDSLIDTETGEMRERSTQLAFEALLGKEPDSGLQPLPGSRISNSEGDIRHDNESTENPFGQQLADARA